MRICSSMGAQMGGCIDPWPRWSIRSHGRTTQAGQANMCGYKRRRQVSKVLRFHWQRPTNLQGMYILKVLENWFFMRNTSIWLVFKLMWYHSIKKNGMKVLIRKKMLLHNIIVDKKRTVMTSFHRNKMHWTVFETTLHQLNCHCAAPSGCGRLGQMSKVQNGKDRYTVHWDTSTLLRAYQYSTNIKHSLQMIKNIWRWLARFKCSLTSLQRCFFKGARCWHKCSNMQDLLALSQALLWS